MTGRNRVYVVETTVSGTWRVMFAATSRRAAWQLMAQARSKWSTSTFRTLPYDSPVTR